MVALIYACDWPSEPKWLPSAGLQPRGEVNGTRPMTQLSKEMALLRQGTSETRMELQGWHYRDRAAEMELQAAGMALQGWRCRDGAAGMALQGWCCRDGAAGMVLQGWWCRDGAAGMVLQGWSCRDGAAGMVLQGWSCKDGTAGIALQGWSCRDGAADTHPCRRKPLRPVPLDAHPRLLQTQSPGQPARTRQPIRALRCYHRQSLI